MCFGECSQIKGVCKTGTAKVLSAHMCVDCCCLRVKPGQHSVHDPLVRGQATLCLPEYTELDQLFGGCCITYLRDHVIATSKDWLILQQMFKLQQLKIVP